VPRLRTKMSMLKTRGVLAAKNKLCFTRTGRYLFLAAALSWGARGGLEGQVAPALSSDPVKVSPKSERRA